MAGETKREYAPSGAQNPPVSHVVPPSKTSTTAAIPAAKSAFEISAARQRRGNELNTMRAHARSFSPDVSM